MALPVNFCGSPKNLTATGNVAGVAGAQPVSMTGFYVNSTSTGVIAFRGGGASGTAIGGSITPAIGWHFYPFTVDPPLHMTLVSGSIDVSISLTSGA